MAEPVFQTAFSAGHISRKLYSRVDLDKYHVGAALLYNCFVDYQGGVSSRPGTKLLLQCRSGTNRVSRFQVSTSQAYVLVWSNFALRFLANDAPLIDITANITGISRANPGVFSCVNAFANGDWVIISGVNGMALNGLSQLNGRAGVVANRTGATFTLTDPLTNLAINTTGFTAYVNGGIAQRIYTLPTVYAQADLLGLKFTQSADVLTITHPNYPPTDLSRTAPSTFAFSVTNFGPSIATPTGLAATTNHAGHRRYGYTVTAVSLDQREESLPALYQTVDSDFLDPNNAVYNMLTWDPVAGAGSYNIYKWGDIQSDGTSPDNSVFGLIATAYTTNYTDNNVAPDYAQTPPTFRNPFAPGAILSASVSASGAGYTDKSYQAATITGDGTGATGYGIANTSTGKIVGFVLQIWGTGYTHAAVTFTGGGPGAGATVSFTFAPLVGVNPSCCSYFQQRRCYAASPNEPATIEMSQTANFTNFDRALIELPQDSIELTIDAAVNSSTQVNAIKSMVAMQSGLVSLTSAAAFVISGGAIGEAIKPNQTVARAQASTGANDLQPIVVNNDLLFVTNKGPTVRNLIYNFYVQSFTSSDRSVLASDLLYGFQILDWAYAEEPWRIIWSVRNDGRVLSFTYVPEQEIYAWAEHQTNGIFQSVCTISQNNEDMVYFVVSRNGIQFIERFATRQNFGLAVNAWFVDCALSTTFGSPQTRIGGLWHLIGQTVTGVADGMVIAPQVVASDGSITLAVPATVVTVGLSFVAQIQTLPLDTGTPTISGKRKIIPSITLFLFQTRGIKVGPSFDELTELKDLALIPYSVPAELVSGEYQMTVRSHWTQYGQICIQQDYPLPMNILGIVPEVTVGDTQR